MNITMESIMLKKQFILLLLLTVSWATGCFNDDNTPQIPESVGYLTINLSQSNLSSSINWNLLPDVDLEIEEYVISGTGPNGASFQATTGNDTYTSGPLVFGQWTIGVSAKNIAGIIIATGTITAQVNSGMTNVISLEVRPVEGIGTLALTVSWDPADVQTPSIVAKLIPASGSVMDLAFIVGPGSASFSGNNIPTGYYTLSVKLQDNNIDVMGAVEIVRIMNNATTNGSYAFTTVNQPGGSVQVDIDVNMNEPLTVGMSGVGDTLIRGNSITAQASAAASIPAVSGNLVYAWYLNGNAKYTGESYAFGSDLAAGSYRLDVVITTADGSRAGSASHVFQVVKNDAKAITAFKFESSKNSGKISGDLEGTITGNAINLVSSTAIDPSALVATFTTTGQKVEVGAVVQESGVTVNDFSGPVTYTVTAEDGTTQTYIVTVTNPVTLYWEPVFVDTFSGDNATNNIGTNWTLDMQGSGTTFMHTSGRMVALGNYTASSETHPIATYKDTTSVSYETIRLSADIKTGGTLNMGKIVLSARNFDAGLFFDSAEGHMIAILGDDGNGTTILASASVPSIATHFWYRLEYIINGKTLTLNLTSSDGAVISTVSYALQPTTNFTSFEIKFFGQCDDTALSLDNFRIDKPAPAEPVWFPLFLDTFAGDNATTGIGANWGINLQSGGTTFMNTASRMVAFGNTNSSSETHPIATYKDTTLPNYTNLRVSADFKTGATVYYGKVALHARNYDAEICFDRSSGHLLAIIFNDGSSFIIRQHQYIPQLAANTWYNIEFIIQGSVLTLNLKNSGGTVINTISYTQGSSTYSSNAVRFFGQCDNTILYLDNFRIDRGM